MTTGQVLSCSVATLAANASATVLVRTTNAAGAPAAACTGTRLNNVATATATGPLSVQDTGDYTCTPPPDVSVVKSTSTPAITAGGTASYSNTVTAGGTGSSTNVTLADTLPGGLTWAIGGPNAASCSIAGSLLTCGFGTMAQGSTRTITLTATTSLVHCPSISNTATVSADVDANTGNNTSGPIPITVSCPTACSSSIDSNFNGTAISQGNFIWFNSVLKPSGLGANPVTILFHNSTIQFTANATPYNLSVPDALITFSPTATTATTTFDTANNRWVTTVPSSGLSGNTFLSGLAFQVPGGGLPGGISPGTWSGQFTTDTPGVTVQWKWAAAVYTSFSTNPNALGVKPVDDNQASQYQNSDHAGTPENFKSFVIGGARGGGGSNYTGSYSATKTPVCPGAAALFLILDEDGIDNGSKQHQVPQTFTAIDVNDDIASTSQRNILRYFADPNNIGDTIVLLTGQVGDEGWFAPTQIPASWASAGPTADGLRKYILAGPGLGSGGNSEVLLDNIPKVIPLRALGLEMLEGRTICALAHDSDISINYSSPRVDDGNLQGGYLGRLAFEVVSVDMLAGLPNTSSSTLPKVTVIIRDWNQVCTGQLDLFTSAPDPCTSSIPQDIDPENPASYLSCP